MSTEGNFFRQRNTANNLEIGVSFVKFYLLSRAKHLVSKWLNPIAFGIPESPGAEKSAQVKQEEAFQHHFNTHVYAICWFSNAGKLLVGELHPKCRLASQPSGVLLKLSISYRQLAVIPSHVLMLSAIEQFVALSSNPSVSIIGSSCLILANRLW